MDSETFNYLYNALYEKPEEPLIIMEAATTAREFYEELKKTKPEAFIIEVEEGPSYISVTQEARIRTAQLLEERAKDLQELAKKATDEKKNPRGNGFLFMAETCKRLAEKEDATPEDREEYRARIKVYEILAEFSKADLCRAFNSGAFNEIFKGYISLMFEGWKDSKNEETRKAAEILGQYAQDNAAQVLDFYNAETALERYGKMTDN